MPAPRRSGRPPASADRGLLAVLRLLVAVVVLGSVVVGAFLAAPYVLEEFEERGTPVELEEPRQSGDPGPDADRGESIDPGESIYVGDAGTVSSGTVEEHVHDEVNERRTERGLEPIEWDDTVASVARDHSVDMYEREYFAHTNPDGEDPLDRFSDVGGYCRAYGENIAMTWVDRPVEDPSDGTSIRHETSEELAEGLVDQWMNSPPHREAILTESWDRGGVGVYLADDGRAIATHNFCETF